MTMHRSRGFIPVYLSVFGIFLFFQLNWAKQSFIYSDIFLRLFLSFLLTAPVLYLLLQSIHLLRTLLTTSDDITGSLLPLYPFALLHLEWFAYVSDRPWQFAPQVIWGITAAAVLLSSIRTFTRPLNAAVSTPAGRWKSFAQVNDFFINGIGDCLRMGHTVLSGRTTTGGLVFYPATWMVIAMQAVLFIKFSEFSFPRPWLLPVYAAATLLMPVLLIWSIRSLTSSIPLAGRVITTTIVMVYYLLTLYNVTENSSFDVSILMLNIDLLGQAQSYALLFDRLRLQSYLLTGFCCAAGLLMLLFRKRPEVSLAIPHTRSLTTGCIIFGWYLLLFFAPLYNSDQIRTLYRSIQNYRLQEKALRKAAALLEDPFPYYHPADAAGLPAGRHHLPDIFLICLESCNGQLIERKTEDGREITPFFNSLIPEGVYPEHFYGNSVQTARGFFSLLTGIPAGFRKKEAVAFPDLAFRGLPAILAEYGYVTMFMKAFHDINYDNTGEFMQKAGFASVQSMTDDMLTDSEKTMCWGWGLQDDYFYRKCFSIVDSQFAATRADENDRPPLFLTTFNVSNHMMFQDIPANQKYLYPDAGPGNFRQNYRNSMFVADSCLRELFHQIDKRKWIRDPLIIIVGDHSFPCGDHSTRNEKGAWEENFRTPFLLLWKEHLAPRRLSRYAYSQIDLMPTLFDLLAISPAHHSIGTSMFAPGPRDPVTLSQPYDGITLVAVEYPFKFISNLEGKSGFLYNIAIDPEERNNRIAQDAQQPYAIRMQNSIARLMANQMLIEQNRLWPAEPRY